MAKAIQIEIDSKDRIYLLYDDGTAWKQYFVKDDDDKWVGKWARVYTAPWMEDESMRKDRADSHVGGTDF